jgi:hypothetical protein
LEKKFGLKKSGFENKKKEKEIPEKKNLEKPKTK